MPSLKACLTPLTNTARTGPALESNGTVLLKQAGKNGECYVMFPTLLFSLSSSEEKKTTIFDLVSFHTLLAGIWFRKVLLYPKRKKDSNRDKNKKPHERVWGDSSVSCSPYKSEDWSSSPGINIKAGVVVCRLSAVTLELGSGDAALSGSLDSQSNLSMSHFSFSERVSQKRRQKMSCWDGLACKNLRTFQPDKLSWILRIRGGRESVPPKFCPIGNAM